MTNPSAARRPVFFILVLLLAIGSTAVMVTTAGDIELRSALEAQGLSEEETAYYRFVAPRLDRLVTEIDDVAEKVDEKSRDILALTISGVRIEELTGEIVAFGEENGVPSRFANIHATILDATETANNTFGQARESLRTFDFTRMPALVEDFRNVTEGLHRAQAEMETIAGGTGDVQRSRGRDLRLTVDSPPVPTHEQD